MDIKKIALIIFVLNSSIFNTPEVFGYGYGTRGKDTLVSVYEDMVALIENHDYQGIYGEVEKIEVPLNNFHKYYGINLKPSFLMAIEKRNGNSIIRAMEQLIFFGVREKIYWNVKEKLAKAVAAKARIKVIVQYYELLKPKIKEYDKENKTAFNREIVNLMIRMTKALGTPGTFGYKAKPARPNEFIRLSSRLEEISVIVFPHFKEGYQAVIKAH